MLGDVPRVKDVSAVLNGAETVIIILDLRPPHFDVFYAETTRTTRAAIITLNLARLVCVTGAMVRHYPNTDIAMAKRFAASRPELSLDKQEQEEGVKASGID